MAAQHGDVDSVQYLLKEERAPVPREPAEDNPAILAAHYGHTQVVKELLDSMAGEWGGKEGEQAERGREGADGERQRVERGSRWRGGGRAGGEGERVGAGGEGRRGRGSGWRAGKGEQMQRVEGVEGEQADGWGG